jgi:hypothetical protein
MGEAAQSSGNSYWGLVLLLVGFGFIAGFSIGIPFLLVTQPTCAVLGPIRVSTPHMTVILECLRPCAVTSGGCPELM